MKSEQVKLIDALPPEAISRLGLVLITALIAIVLMGCASKPSPQLLSPYDRRQVWAVAPLMNESGSSQADGLKMADEFMVQIDKIGGISSLPVNRVLEAMDTLDIQQISRPREAMQVRAALNVDALIVGTITAYDPYDPPRIGVAIELYVNDRSQPTGSISDARRLTNAATDELSLPTVTPSWTNQPVNSISTMLDASDPTTRHQLEKYAVDRGTMNEDPMSSTLYRISMDLYTEFVSYAATRSLLRAESLRLTPPTQSKRNTPELENKQVSVDRKLNPLPPSYLSF